MAKVYKSAAAALADKTPGSRAIQGKFAEAFKLAGIATQDVDGNAAWYCTPISQAPGQSLDDGGAVWIVAVSRSEDANKSSIQAVAKNYAEFLPTAAQEEFTPGFIGYTIGLEANRHPVIGKMVKVEYGRNKDGSVKLNTVSGRDLSKMQGHSVITAEQFANRPQSPYNDVPEARWALKHCGWSLMSDDAEE